MIMQKLMIPFVSRGVYFEGFGFQRRVLLSSTLYKPGITRGPRVGCGWFPVFELLWTCFYSCMDPLIYIIVSFVNSLSLGVSCY